MGHQCPTMEQCHLGFTTCFTVTHPQLWLLTSGAWSASLVLHAANYKSRMTRLLQVMHADYKFSFIQFCSMQNCIYAYPYWTFFATSCYYTGLDWFSTMTCCLFTVHFTLRYQITFSQSQSSVYSAFHVRAFQQLTKSTRVLRRFLPAPPK